MRDWGTAADVPAFRIEVSDVTRPGWEPWHGFPGERWRDGWEHLTDARAVARRVRSCRRRWHVRVVNRHDRPVSVLPAAA